MKEQELLKLGFKKEDYPKEESGEDYDDFYLIYESALITDCRSENEDDFTVSFWEDDSLVFKSYEDLYLFIKIIERCRK